MFAGASKKLLGTTLILALSAALAACSTVAAYQKCGLEGCPGDAAITAHVQQAFTGYPAIEAPNLIDVQTIDHVVYLYGLVDTDLQRVLAGSVAAAAPGVRRVVNSIGLRSAGF